VDADFPPPHHDIYSIEDPVELIFDLRQGHPRAAGVGQNWLPSLV